ncbi:MAG TPA: 16S rRNA (cytosine(967)-C(5))-methyltransferase RsmB [Candidatus Margulisiibacteriota bacterium]|nr:16S rRNA (cytosine(967)-C(5))-methyltransferase RsmB [Candidatus Margulisiibacteriota bacterium]
MKPAAAKNTPARRRPADARALAWEILRRVEEKGAYADALLGHALTSSRFAARDQALVTRLVYGTLAWQGYLDHIIAAFSRRPPQALDAPIRIVLRLALFQICFLSRIPSFAAVNTAVQLAKRFHSGAAAGLVNAVLRRATVEWQQVPLPSPHDDPVGHLATRWSHPAWLAERWLAQYGFDETEALLRANNEPAPTVLRVNRLKMEADQLLARLQKAGCPAQPTRYAPSGIHIEHAGTPDRLPGYREGLFSVQGEASQLVGLLTAPRPGDRVLDACAAPGGKTTHLAELMENRGVIVALDVNARGIERVERMTGRLGVSIVQTAVADATTWQPPTDGFDCVVVDAPCSGLGTLRQHPEVRWRRTTENIAALAALQQQLLLHLAGLVRPGGTLVYATCTLSAEENDGVLAGLLHTRPDFSLSDARPLLPAPARPLVDADGVLRTFPHRHGLDGFFAARLKRNGAHGIVTA